MPNVAMVSFPLKPMLLVQAGVLSPFAAVSADGCALAASRQLGRVPRHSVGKHFRSEPIVPCSLHCKEPQCFVIELPGFEFQVVDNR